MLIGGVERSPYGLAIAARARRAPCRSTRRVAERKRPSPGAPQPGDAAPGPALLPGEIRFEPFDVSVIDGIQLVRFADGPVVRDDQDIGGGAKDPILVVRHQEAVLAQGRTGSCKHEEVVASRPPEVRCRSRHGAFGILPECRVKHTAGTS